MVFLSWLSSKKNTAPKITGDQLGSALVKDIDDYIEKVINPTIDKGFETFLDILISYQSLKEDVPMNAAIQIPIYREHLQKYLYGDADTHINIHMYKWDEVVNELNIGSSVREIIHNRLKDSENHWMLLAEQAAFLMPENIKGSLEFSLGWVYETGTGFKQNFEEANRLYELSAAKGNSGAQYNLGLSYLKGRGCVFDIMKSYLYLSLAIANDIDEAKKLEGASLIESLEKEMTSAELEAAKELVSNFELSFS